MSTQILEDKAKAITEELMLHGLIAKSDAKAVERSVIAGSFQFLEADNNIQVKTGKVVGAQR